MLSSSSHTQLTECIVACISQSAADFLQLKTRDGLVLCVIEEGSWWWCVCIMHVEVQTLPEWVVSAFWPLVRVAPEVARGEGGGLQPLTRWCGVCLGTGCVWEEETE